MAAVKKIGKLSVLELETRRAWLTEAMASADVLRRLDLIQERLRIEALLGKK